MHRRTARPERDTPAPSKKKKLLNADAGHTIGYGIKLTTGQPEAFAELGSNTALPEGFAELMEKAKAVAQAECDLWKAGHELAIQINVPIAIARLLGDNVGVKRAVYTLDFDPVPLEEKAEG